MTEARWQCLTVIGKVGAIITISSRAEWQLAL